jgi:hypothetical protein
VKKFEFAIHFKFVLLVGKTIMSIMVLWGEHHELFLDIVYPWKWKYLRNLEHREDVGPIKRIEIKIKNTAKSAL